MEKILNIKWLKIGLLLAAGLVLAGGIVFAGVQIGKNSNLKTQISKPQPKTQSEKTTPTPTPKPTLPQPEGVNETADWKTYTNPVLGYSIRYPETLKVTVPQLEGDPAVKLVVFTDMTVDSNGNPDDANTLYKKVGGIGGIGGVVIYRSFWLRVETTGLDSPDDVIETVHSSNKDSGRLNINGGVAYKRTASDMGGGYEGTTIWIDAVKGKKVVNIVAMFPSNVENYPILFDQILSTFKFLD